MDIAPFSLTNFRAAYMDAAMWCTLRASQLSLKESLRSAELRPLYALETPIERSNPYPQYSDPSYGEKLVAYHMRYPRALAERQQIVDAIARVRRNLLVSKHLTQQGNIDASPYGRLLVFNPEDSLSDGAADVATAGFFDYDNPPPWDTWVSYEVVNVAESRSYLVCFVPESFVERANTGIEVNPEACILWLDDLQAPFADELRRSGIL